MARKKTKSVSLTPQASLPDLFAQGFVILLAVLIVYIPAMTANFIWDDDQLLTVNPAVQGGFDGLVELWKGTKTADYFPLTSSVLWLEYRLWGRVWETPDVLNGYHIVNIVLHAIAALLLWRTLVRLAIPGAWLAALIFAVHPICVESVAWVSELKNTLSQILFFLTLMAYFDFEKSERGKFYIRAVFLFVLAMLAKTSVVMLPFVLLLVAWWQNGFSGIKGDPVTLPGERNLLKYTNLVIGAIGVIGGALALKYLVGLNSHFYAVNKNQDDPIIFATHIFKKGYLDHEFWFLSGLAIATGLFGILGGLYGGRYNRHLIRVLAFFQIAVLLGAITVWFQYGRAIGDEEIPIGGFPSRLANAGMAYWFYLGKSLWPIDLLVIYPRWNIKPPALWEFWGCAALAATFAVCWWKRSSWGRHVLFGLGYFVLTLLPAIGFLKMSYMRLTLVADHFQYLSMVGIIALLVGAAAYYYQKAAPQFRPLFIGVAAIIVVGSSWLTWKQSSIYRGEETLWFNTLRKNPDSWQAHNHYGAVLFQKGIIGADEHDPNGAMFHFSEAVRLKPENPESHNNLGLALVTKKRMEEGIAQYRRAVEIKGDEPSMRTNLANALAQGKYFDEAIKEYREVLKMTPGNPNIYCALGYTLIQTGRLDEAIEAFQKALKIAPGMPQAKQNLDAALQMKRSRQMQPAPR